MPTGSDAITAEYNGNANFTVSVSSAVNQIVNPDATTTVVTSSTNPSVFGQSITFTATVAALAPGTGTPTGLSRSWMVQTSLGIVSLSNRKATLKTSVLAASLHAITVVYGGDGNFMTSTSTTLAQTVNVAGTSSAVVSSASTSVFGQSVTFTAMVKAAAPGSGTPTGHHQVLGRFHQSWNRHAQWRHGHAFHINTRRRPRDQRDLWRRRQLRHQHVAHRGANSEASGDDGFARFFSKSLSLGSNRNLHSDCRCRVAW